MVRMVKGSGCALVMALLVAACSGNVDVQSAVGSTSASSTTTSGAGAGSSTSSAGGGGMGGSGGGILPPPSCAPGEAAIVTARAGSATQVAFDLEGTWTKNAITLPAPAPSVTYLDGYDHLGLLWIDVTKSPAQTRFVVTSDGTSFEMHDVHSWSPQQYGPLAAVGRDVLLVPGPMAPGVGLARFDEDAYDWMPLPGAGPVPLQETSSAVLLPSTIMAVGLGPQHQLCDVSLGNAVWGSVHCRDAITVATGGEIPVTRPQAVTLPNGDVVVVYYQGAGVTLAATTLHEGVWSAPDPITSSAIGINFSLAATPQGDALAALATTGGEVSALRYTPGAGWGKPISIASGESTYLVGVTVAAGICGDDALVAFGRSTSDGIVSVARVRGDDVEVTQVGGFPDQTVYDLSIATRPVAAFP